MNGWLKGWMASEAANQDKIEVKRVYIDLNEGNLYDGVMFSQIMYWHGVSRETGKPRMSIERDGKLWLVKGYGDWWEECRIIEPTARASINRMAERGLIVKKLWKFKGAPTLHIRIDWDSLEEQLMWLCDDVSNGFDSKYQIGNDMSYQNHLTPDHKSLTDTTSDTTSDTKKQKRNAPRSKKSGWASEDVIILEWARIRNLIALSIGAPLTTQKRRTCARRMLKWARPITFDDIADAIRASKSSDYEFTWLEDDVPKRRAAVANRPTVIPETPLEIVPKGDDTPATPEQIEQAKAAFDALLEKTNANAKPHDPYGGWKPEKVGA